MSSVKNKVFFASDFHLGFPSIDKGRWREKKVVEWLGQIGPHAKAIYLMGDIFDFWFEYRSVAPKGYVRFLGKLAELADSGTEIHIFGGNHDMWLFGYLPAEIGAVVHTEPLVAEISGKRFFMHHGHGLGPYDKGMNFLKGIFSNKLLQWCFARIHPNASFAAAGAWSRKSRKSKGCGCSDFHGIDKEWLVLYARDVLKEMEIDYFIFGHRHLAMDINLTGKSRYINLGHWLSGFTFAVFDGQSLELREYRGHADMPLHKTDLPI
jgi:UDP-2,3-diacylglucosamine hydrolase